MTYFVHPLGLCESEAIGAGTKIWAFAHVLKGAVLGKDCNICDHVFIENKVIVGDRVTIKSGVQLWDNVTLEDDVFIGPNATFTNDLFPRSKQYPQEFAKTLVRHHASVGANATLLCGLTIGAYAMVGAGSVVTKDVPPNAIVAGNPARILGYVDTAKSLVPTGLGVVAESKTPMGRAALFRLPLIEDIRGSLSFAEIDGQLPFTPLRYFLVFDVPNKEVRGEHAHRTLHQFLVCIKGSCSIALDDGSLREEIPLDAPTLGLHIPPMIWSVQYKYSADAVLLVLASDIYHADDYIRDYDEFQALIKAREKHDGSLS